MRRETMKNFEFCSLGKTSFLWEFIIRTKKIRATLAARTLLHLPTLSFTPVLPHEPSRLHQARPLFSLA
jgi:hypothetical protein